MAGFYTGRSGSLHFDDKIVAKIRDWSLEGTTELLSTNSIDSKYNTFTPGVKGATGSATLLLYRLQSGESSSTYTEAFNVIRKGMAFTLDNNGATQENARFKFKLMPSTREQETFTFFAYITSASVSVSTGELSSVSINFTVDGRFTDAPDLIGA